jgi:cell division protein FtsZ
MIKLTRPTHSIAPVVKILGLGGAGGNTLDRLVLDGLEGSSIIALNTDVQALNGSVAPQKIHLGKTVTRGLGSGGDPEIGYEAAEEAADEIKAAIEGANMVFLCAGLGGGTGSGAAPLVAHMARSAGAMVIAFATMPFSFEGKRRRTQAAESLAQLEEQADLVVCFENDRLGEAVSPNSGVQQAFVAADQTLSQAIRTIATLVRRGGIINIGLDELASALRRQHPRCLFGYGESDGANRPHEALQRALKSPLMDKGRMLAESPSVLVHIAGGPDLTISEITVLMDEFNRHISDHTRIDFGVGTDAKLGKRLCVTIISSVAAASPSAARTTRPVATRAAVPVDEIFTPAPDADEMENDDDFQPGDDIQEPEPKPQPIAKATPAPLHAAPPLGAHNPKEVPVQKTAAASKKDEKAEQLPLEPANRGRFEKSEPTIVDGQDLDVPTFLRKNLKVK